jgi:hypothetical protein
MITGLHIPWISAERQANRLISGPTPAGSPMVIAMMGLVVI